MIHDILLSLLSANLDPLPIEDFLVSDNAKTLMHPGELKILADILKIANQHKSIQNFIQQYSTTTNPLNVANKSVEVVLDDSLNGLYVQAFCDGIDSTLQFYRTTVVDLERRYLRKPNFSLLFIFYQIEKFQPLLSFILGLISGIKTQKLHGCTILHYLQQNSLHGNENISVAVKLIQKSVYRIFLKQLSQWLLYGKFVDSHSEFFIQNVETNITASEKYGSISGVATATTISDSTSLNHEMWRYVVCCDMLPHYFPLSWAEKVLFIGQTVLMFNSPPRDQNRRADLWNSEDTIYMKISLFGYEEHVFFQKFDKLFECDSINTAQIEQIVDQIKKCVTKHLSEIAINQADLMKQLRIIKDYYLLGRGELFLEFIKNIQTISKKIIGDGTMRDINKAFRLASNSVNISDDAEQFTFYVPKDEIDSFSYETKGFINFLTLRYKVKWPLHLLFSPKVLERYNDMFRFLLKIKQLQYDLHLVWCHHRENKMEKNSKILQLRNKFMFLVDNLQYYLQADVLESQFSILMNTIQNSKDFEHIQRAHTMFQANVLSLCFLLNTTEPSTNSDIIHIPENPILTILNKILMLIDSFYVFSLNTVDPMTQATKEQINNFDQLFTDLMKSLLNMFIGLKAGPSNAPLSQLLLRLDYNYFFSSQTKIIVEDEENKENTIENFVEIIN